MPLTSAARSEQGPRAVNQDYFHRDPDLGLFIVADGMGGHNAGEVASKLAVETVVDFIRATKTGRDLTWPFPFDPLQSVGANRLTVALRLANRRVHDMARANVDLDGMGTTIVAALIGSGRVAIGHVGDSRAYRLHDGKLDQLTRDDTWVAMLGREAEDEIANPAEHPLRHVLTSGIGMKEQVKPTLTELELVRGDQWLLCTDGVHGYVEEAALQQALAQPSAEAAADAVIAAASATTNDNATVIVFRLG